MFTSDGASLEQFKTCRRSCHKMQPQPFYLRVTAMFIVISPYFSICNTNKCHCYIVDKRWRLAGQGIISSYCIKFKKKSQVDLLDSYIANTVLAVKGLNPIKDLNGGRMSQFLKTTLVLDSGYFRELTSYQRWFQSVLKHQDWPCHPSLTATYILTREKSFYFVA